jgi:hypothetical protein
LTWLMSWAIVVAPVTRPCSSLIGVMLSHTKVTPRSSPLTQGAT